MTALEKYVRLEALGLWRESAETAPREVVVSFGNATLVLTDLEDRPLGHWALAGAQPSGRTADGATVYSMTLEGDETLTLRDPEMIAAIAAVSRAYRRAPPLVPPRPRFPLGLSIAALALAGALVYGPDLARDLAIRMVPPEQAEEFGDRMLIGLQDTRGALCADPAGLRALAHLSDRVAEGAPLRVLDLGGAGPVAVLPGPTVLIDRAALGAAGSPEELAGWITAALGADPAGRPVRDLMRAAGPAANLRYILTGELTDPALASAATAALSAPPAAQGFVPASGPAAATLTDQDWVALQGICG